MYARGVFSTAPDRAAGVICDRLIAMNGFYISKDYPEHLRRIRLKRPQIGQDLGISYQHHQFAIAGHRRALQE